VASRGSGPGVITNDGCAVEVYAGLPPRPEAELIRRLVAPGASILDLGAGTGRLAEPLATMGFRVVAVDDSPDMLAHVTTAEPVEAQIEGLLLDERFDVVLLASHLVNTDDDAQRREFLATAVRHLKPAGRVVLEWHPPTWFDGLVPGATSHGSVDDLTVTLHVKDLAEGLLDASVVYRRGENAWSQDFQARRLTLADLTEVLGQAQLVLEGNLADDDSWLVARPL
jgi:SAM-dependent methyltransferase